MGQRPPLAPGTVVLVDARARVAFAARARGSRQPSVIAIALPIGILCFFMALILVAIPFTLIMGRPVDLEVVYLGSFLFVASAVPLAFVFWPPRAVVGVDGVLAAY